MSDAEKPSDRLYRGVEALKGWSDALYQAHHFGASPYQTRIGGILSSVLLAAGEEREPVAIAGELGENGNGYLIVIYSDLVVLVVVEQLTGTTGDSTVTVHSLDEVEGLTVSTRHNYYTGVGEYRRHDGIRISLKLGGKFYTLPHGRWGESPLVGDAATLAALVVLREHKVNSK